MNRNSWIYLFLMVTLLATFTVILVILFMPETTEFQNLMSNSNIQEEQYKYVAVKIDPSTTNPPEETYEITKNDIKSAQNKQEYVPGNINPFTPKNEITIYNEPSLNGGSGSTNNKIPTGNTSGK